MADKTFGDGQKLKVVLDKGVEVGLCHSMNKPEETRTKMRKLMYFGMYFIAPMLLVLFLMMCTKTTRKKLRVTGLRQ